MLEFTVEIFAICIYFNVSSDDIFESDVTWNSWFNENYIDNRILGIRVSLCVLYSMLDSHIPGLVNTFLKRLMRFSAKNELDEFVFYKFRRKNNYKNLYIFVNTIICKLYRARIKKTNLINLKWWKFFTNKFIRNLVSYDNGESTSKTRSRY